MCRRVTCRTCGKPTWSGCGAHVEQVLGDVPQGDRCSRDHVPGAGGADGSAWLMRLFSRGGS